MQFLKTSLNQFVFFILLIFPVVLKASGLDLSDVSILLPLPTSTKDISLLPAISQKAEAGDLLPRKVYEQIPLLVQAPKEDIWKRLHLVGMRIDPYFVEGAAPLRGRPQIRMIWQPVIEVGGQVVTQDAALHSFYELSVDEMKDLLIALEALKSSGRTHAALGVHPVIEDEGLNGVYFNKLWSVIKKYTGEKRLSRVTFMQVNLPENIWTFGGFDIKNQILQPLLVARLGVNIQAFVNNMLQKPFSFRGGLFPEPRQTENLNLLTRDSSRLTSADEAEVISSVRAAIRFQNPNHFNPGNLDCVSCHIAQAVELWALREHPELNLKLRFQEEIYKSAFNLKNISPFQNNTNVLRAFGYFFNRPVVSQRAINETASVLQLIESGEWLKK